jgi:hypothetical protein
VVVGLRPLIIKGLASQVGAVQQISCGEDFALFLCRESDQGLRLWLQRPRAARAASSEGNSHMAQIARLGPFFD